MRKEQYQPSTEEKKRAEEMMTEEQHVSSESRGAHESWMVDHRKKSETLSNPQLIQELTSANKKLAAFLRQAAPHGWENSIRVEIRSLENQIEALNDEILKRMEDYKSSELQ